MSDGGKGSHEQSSVSVDLMPGPFYPRLQSHTGHTAPQQRANMMRLHKTHAKIAWNARQLNANIQMTLDK